MVETQWTGLDPDHTYSLSAYDKDAPDCGGTLIVENFLTGITDGVAIEHDMLVTTLSVAKATNRWI